MKLYDISRTITPFTAVWPGDAAFHYDMVMSLKEGQAVNLTTLHLSAHTGTHADAYWHYEQTGAHPAGMPLESYIGPCHVVTIIRQSGAIMPDEITGIDFADAPRLLLHSYVSNNADDQWPAQFPYPSVALIDALAGQGVVLLGLDSPSMDALDSKDLPGHHRLYQHGMVNLECLNLSGVPDGRYELIALPLKLSHVCGSPVRAILREQS